VEERGAGGARLEGRLVWKKEDGPGYE
jgi:hypothetical protein